MEKKARTASPDDAARLSRDLETALQTAHSVAHDLNSLLAVIEGYAEMTRDDVPSDSPAGPHIEQVLRAVKRAKSLVAKLQKTDQDL
ncbi:MAG: hypothetical protein P9L99_04525 [Candidatus Lernaella stagnicola]|nr:hypothetical protein [Candidatus Lernaella stagnicola]